MEQTKAPPVHYTLRCLATGACIVDDDRPLHNPAAHAEAFLRTEYRASVLRPGPHEEGIYRFREWLPVHRTLEGSGAPVTWRSSGLADHLGLERLYITFSGYWPERGARMLTGTFKECEAYSVCARIPAGDPTALVVASAGNTARAFARVCSDNRMPLVVVIPERNLDALWSVGPVSTCVKILAAGGDSDYSDAIALAGIVSKLPGFAPEGGAKNVARRDGMGTTVLSAVETIGELPHHYFQAIGSGTGAIAAWEANLRLLASGRYGDRLMRLHVSQNRPFTLIHDSWTAGSRALVPMSEDEARSRTDLIGAKVLANRTPPYSLVGGLYDALTATGGTTAAITNTEATDAAALFERLEGCDVSPAAAVAVAHLVAAAGRGSIARGQIVMLNVTGGGYRGIRADLPVRQVAPTRVIDRRDFNADSVGTLLRELFQEDP